MSKESLLPATQLSSELRTQLREKYEKVLEKLNAIQLVSTSSFKTHCKFKFIGGEERTENEYDVLVKAPPSHSPDKSIDISMTVDLLLLLKILGFLLTKEKEYQNAIKVLELKEAPLFTWQGSKLEDWQSDIKIRIAVITSKHEKERLEKVKSELSSYFSTEDRLMDLLESI